MDPTRIHFTVPLILMGMVSAVIIWFGLGYICGMHTRASYYPSTIHFTIEW